MKKILLLSFFFVILNILGCENKTNKAEVKPSKEKSVKVSKYEEAYSKCLESAGIINNTTVAGCSNSSTEMAEKDMNVILKQIHAKLNDDEYKANAFKEFQAAWEVYLKAEADFNSRVIGSPAGGVSYYKGISKRIDVLNEELKGLK